MTQNDSDWCNNNISKRMLVLQLHVHENTLTKISRHQTDGHWAGYDIYPQHLTDHNNTQRCSGNRQIETNVFGCLSTFIDTIVYVYGGRSSA